MSLDTTTPKTPAGPVGALAPLAVPIDTLDYLPGNPRRGDVPAVAASLTRFGQRKPIVAKRDGTVIAGNHTLEAARSLGWETIAVVYVDDDDATAKAFALADNRTAELGSYDDEALAELIAAVRDADEVLYGATGWTDADLDELVAKIEAAQPRPALTDPDEVPDQAPAITVPGDVWLLGPHRVVCGDSCDTEVIGTALDGNTAALLVTDPPYGVSYADKNRYLNAISRGNRIQVPIENDHLSEADVSQLWRDVFTSVRPHLQGGASYYVTGPQGGDLLLLLLLALSDCGFPLRHMLIWVKNQFVLGRSDYNYQHEPIVYGWVEGAHQFHGGGGETSTWFVDKPHASKLHPTMKPVELWARAIRNSTPAAATVLDPFGGSGTAVMACHQTGRRAALVELDPGYVDIICRRYQQHTGTLPVNATTGKAHDFCA